jgi:transposase InsO family protein
MTKNARIVLAIIEDHRTVTDVARAFNVSRTWVYELLKRYELFGLPGLTGGSKRPHHNARALTNEQHDEIAQLRSELLGKGLDAGAQTIRFHLEQRHGHAPALSTIWRSLRNQGLVEHQPQKKPKSYLIRFEADQPNETWQADVTHIRLADGRVVDVLDFLDDHSRFLISVNAHRSVTTPIVVQDFSAAISEHGTPQSTLTDNGLVFTTRLRGGRNAFEHLLDRLGIDQKNSSPHHPQTQGKIERFHQTLKKWLASQPTSRSIRELQARLDQFREIYNTQRPHKSLRGRTPHTAFHARPKAQPLKEGIFGRSRTRTDTVDNSGKISLRRNGKLHHLGAGPGNSKRKVFLIIDTRHVIVTDYRSGEIISEHTIEPARTYWPNTLNKNETR